MVTCSLGGELALQHRHLLHDPWAIVSVFCPSDVPALSAAPASICRRTACQYPWGPRSPGWDSAPGLWLPCKHASRVTPMVGMSDASLAAARPFSAAVRLSPAAACPEGPAHRRYCSRHPGVAAEVAGHARPGRWRRTATRPGRCGGTPARAAGRQGEPGSERGASHDDLAWHRRAPFPGFFVTHPVPGPPAGCRAVRRPTVPVASTPGWPFGRERSRPGVLLPGACGD
jgi:hypothetical protein